MNKKVTEKIELSLLAGTNPDGKPIMEKIQAYVLEAENRYELIKSPIFLRDLAAGDVFSIGTNKPSIAKVVQRSGKLSIRVFRKSNINDLEQRLTPEVEKLDGSLDIQTERALAYSLHVNLGFSEIESLLDNIMAEFTDSVWYYGNVYDPKDGVTPLKWWDEFLNTI